MAAIFFNTEVTFEDNADFDRNVTVTEDHGLLELCVPRDERGVLAVRLTPGQARLLRDKLDEELDG